jgi:hypothetical protein
VTRALNCALSATTKKPQINAMGASIKSDLPKKKPTMSEHVPLTMREIVTSRSREFRSAYNPPHTHPIPPTAIVPNAIRETISGDPRFPVDAAALAARNAGIHAQNA